MVFSFSRRGSSVSSADDRCDDVSKTVIETIDYLVHQWSLAQCKRVASQVEKQTTSAPRYREKAKDKLGQRVESKASRGAAQEPTPAQNGPPSLASQIIPYTERTKLDSPTSQNEKGPLGLAMWTAAFVALTALISAALTAVSGD